MCYLENIYFVRPDFSRKAELTNLEESIEPRKSVLHNGNTTWNGLNPIVENRINNQDLYRVWHK